MKSFTRESCCLLHWSDWHTQLHPGTISNRTSPGNIRREGAAVHSPVCSGRRLAWVMALKLPIDIDYNSSTTTKPVDVLDRAANSRWCYGPDLPVWMLNRSSLKWFLLKPLSPLKEANANDITQLWFDWRFEWLGDLIGQTTIGFLGRLYFK